MANGVGHSKNRSGKQEMRNGKWENGIAMPKRYVVQKDTSVGSV